MMSIDHLSESDIIGRGELASVFAAGPGRVLKLYPAEGPSPWQGGLPRLYSEEIRAYELAAGDPVLSHHVPSSYDRVTVVQVTDAVGRDVSTRYLLSLGLALERLERTELKIRELADIPDQLRQLLMLENSDVITFHSYDDSATVEKLITALERYGRPVICSEYMLVRAAAHSKASCQSLRGDM